MKLRYFHIAQLLGSMIVLGQIKKTCQSQMLQSHVNQKMVNKWNNKNQCHQLKKIIVPKKGDQ